MKQEESTPDLDPSYTDTRTTLGEPGTFNGDSRRKVYLFPRFSPEDINRL